jgi:hypothetical protein
MAYEIFRYGQVGAAPTLYELMHEPVIRLIVERAKVTEGTLRRIITISRRHLGGNSAHPPQDTGQLFSPQSGQDLGNRTPIARRPRVDTASALEINPG